MNVPQPIDVESLPAPLAVRSSRSVVLVALVVALLAYKPRIDRADESYDLPMTCAS